MLGRRDEGRRNWCWQGCGQENLTALQRSVDSMEDKGMAEDPRYSQMMMRGRPPMQVRIFQGRCGSDMCQLW